MGFQTSKCIGDYSEDVLCEEGMTCNFMGNIFNTHENSHTPHSCESFYTKNMEFSVPQPSQKFYKDPRVKLFYHMYCGRDTNYSNALLEERLNSSWNISPIDTLRIIFYFRDSVYGGGLKNIFKESCMWLYKNHANALDKNYIHIPYYGTWKDLQRIFCGTLYEYKIINYHTEKLRESLNLLKKDEISQIDFGISKYAPTEGSEYDKKYNLVSKFARELGITKKEYRKNYIRPLRSINPSVEELMCAGRWDDIDFSKVPNKAFIRYKNVFSKRCSEKYYNYICKLYSIEKDFDNNSSLPYIISHCIRYPEFDRWNSSQMECYNFDDEDYTLYVLNTTKSMFDNSKSTFSFRKVSVSFALMFMTGIMYKENSPIYKKYFNYSKEPTVRNVIGNEVKDIINNNTENWNGDIDFTKLYENILQFILDNCLKKSPKSVIIVSDTPSSIILPSYENIQWKIMEEKYSEHNIECPPIIYWNPEEVVHNPYIDINNAFFTIIEGYNLNILNHLIKHKTFDPYIFMRSIIDSERYSKISV